VGAGCPGVEADALVQHLDEQLVALRQAADVGPVGRSVPCHIVESLLHDAVGGGLDLPGEAPVEALVLEVNLQAGLRRVHVLHQPEECREQPEVVQHGGRRASEKS